MQPIFRKTKSIPSFIMPLVIFGLYSVKMFPSIRIYPDIGHLTAQLGLAVLLSLAAAYLWHSFMGKNYTDRFSPLLVLIITLLTTTLASIFVFSSGHFESALKVLLAIPVIIAAFLLGRFEALILTCFVTVSFASNYFFGDMSNFTYAKTSSEIILLLSLVFISFAVPRLKRRTPESFQHFLLSHYTEGPLRILDSSLFWQTVAASSDSPISPDTISALRMLLLTLEERDQYAIGHSVRVMIIAFVIADALKLSCSTKNKTMTAALFHDLGRLEISSHLLNKTEPLTCEEKKIIQLHPQWSVLILKDFKAFDCLYPAILNHHEWFNGQGSKNGEEETISPEGRIIAVADSIDAMASLRPYRKRKSRSEIVQELNRLKGIQFDPEIVDKAIKTVCTEQFMLSLGL